MLKLLGGLQRLAQFDLILEEQHLGRLLPALRIANKKIRNELLRDFSAGTGRLLTFPPRSAN